MVHIFSFSLERFISMWNYIVIELFHYHLGDENISCELLNPQMGPIRRKLTNRVWEEDWDRTCGGFEWPTVCVVESESDACQTPPGGGLAPAAGRLPNEDLSTWKPVESDPWRRLDLDSYWRHLSSCPSPRTRSSLFLSFTFTSSSTTDRSWDRASSLDTTSECRGKRLWHESLLVNSSSFRHQPLLNIGHDAREFSYTFNSDFTKEGSRNHTSRHFHL